MPPIPPRETGATLAFFTIVTVLIASTGVSELAVKALRIVLDILPALKRPGFSGSSEAAC